jgi:hypothetical protein
MVAAALFKAPLSRNWRWDHLFSVEKAKKIKGKGWMNEEGRVKRRSGQGSSTEGRRRAEPRGEQVFLAGENAACLRIIQPLPLPLLYHHGKKDSSILL